MRIILSYLMSKVRIYSIKSWASEVELTINMCQSNHKTRFIIVVTAALNCNSQ